MVAVYSYAGVAKKSGLSALGRFGLGLVASTLLTKGANQVHEVPAYLFRRSIAFAGHLPFAAADDPKELAVGHLLDGRSIAPVMQVELHLHGKIAFPIA